MASHGIAAAPGSASERGWEIPADVYSKALGWEIPSDLSEPGLGTVLGGVPDAEDVDRIVSEEPVHQDVGADNHQLTIAWRRSTPAAAGERRQTIASDQQLARNTGGCNRIVGSYVGGNPYNIGQRLGRPDNRSH